MPELQVQVSFNVLSLGKTLDSACLHVLKPRGASVDMKEETESDPQKYSWLRMKSKEEDSESERKTLAGSIQRDVALWFSMASIGAAWLPGPVTHRDVMHAYAIVVLWAVLHNSCRRATIWTKG